MTRTSRALAAAGLAVLLLAGCGDGAAAPGTAAVVGDTRITTEELQSLVERGLQDPAAQQQFGAARADYQRQVLNRMVRAELLEIAAGERGVEVTAADVDERLKEFARQAGGREQLEEQAAAGGIHPDDLRRFAREVVLEVALADAVTEDVDVPAADLERAYQQNIGQLDRVRTRHILVEDEAQAREIAAQVEADPDRFAELAAEFSTDESNAQEGGELGFAGRGQFVTEFEDAAFGAKEGDVVVVQTQFGWHVVQVLERQTTSPQEAAPDLRRSLLREEREERLQELLRETAERVGVEVNPRFGRWDPETAQVVPAPEDDGVSSPAPQDGAGTGQQVPGQEPAPAPAR